MAAVRNAAKKICFISFNYAAKKISSATLSFFNVIVSTSRGVNWNVGLAILTNIICTSCRGIRVDDNYTTFTLMKKKCHT